MGFILRTSSDDDSHLYQVAWKYVERFRNYGADIISVLSVINEHYSVKNVYRVLVLFNLSDYA